MRWYCTAHRRCPQQHLLLLVFADAFRNAPVASPRDIEDCLLEWLCYCQAHFSESIGGTLPSLLANDDLLLDCAGTLPLLTLPPRPPSSIIKISLRRPSSLPDSLSYQMASQSSAFLPCTHRGPGPCTGAYFCSQRHSLTACPTSTLCWLCALKCSYRCLLQQSSLPPLALSEPPPTHALRSQVTPHVPPLALNP